jgi:UDP-N-acetylmuramoylalanine--D-glutamate ligase
MQEEIFRKLDGKKIAILGFGLEGKSTYKFIRRFSDCVLYILDQKDYSNDELIKDDSNVVVICDNYLDHLDSYDVIIKAPGVILKDIDTTIFKDKITSQ